MMHPGVQTLVLGCFSGTVKAVKAYVMSVAIHNPPAPCCKFRRLSMLKQWTQTAHMICL